MASLGQASVQVPHFMQSSVMTWAMVSIFLSMPLQRGRSCKKSGGERRRSGRLSPGQA
jgi:hypothetical protein